LLLAAPLWAAAQQWDLVARRDQGSECMALCAEELNGDRKRVRTVLDDR
jgi:hypothetical protein